MSRLEAKRAEHLNTLNKQNNIDDTWEPYAQRIKSNKNREAQALRSQIRSDLELVKKQEKANIEA